MLSRAKGLRVLFVLSFLFLIAGLTSSRVNVASGATAPLVPSVDVSPNHVCLGDEITLVVKVQVNAKSNVSASKPRVMGVGDAFLLSEKGSAVVEAGEIAKLVWTYNATQLGTIYFSSKISVTNLIDGNVTLSESLSSNEIGISRSPKTFLLGLAIISLYVLLTSKFGAFKPKVSPFELMGRFFGLSMAILFFILGMLVGHFIVPLGQTTEIQPTVTLGIFGSLLSIFGFGFCLRHKKHLTKEETERGSAKITELGGLLIVISGLSGFFFIMNAYFELVLLVVVSVLGIGKEFMEMEIESEIEGA